MSFLYRRVPIRWEGVPAVAYYYCFVLSIEKNRCCTGDGRPQHIVSHISLSIKGKVLGHVILSGLASAPLPLNIPGLFKTSPSGNTRKHTSHDSSIKRPPEHRNKRFTVRQTKLEHSITLFFIYCIPHTLLPCQKSRRSILIRLF